VKHKGLHQFRFRDNPRERRFADEWNRQNEVFRTLDYLLGDGLNPAEPSTRDRLVAATVIQWLGSPVGACFLRDVLAEGKDGGK